MTTAGTEITARRGHPALPWIMAAVVLVLGTATAVWRWNEAAIHGATDVFSRTTTDGVHLTVQHGDVRWSRTICDGRELQCTTRSPGLLVRFDLPSGRSGGGATLPDEAFRTDGCDIADPAVRVITTAGLGLPPGSADEVFIFARTEPGVSKVRAVRPDGTNDEMAPVDNVVVLATRTGFKWTERVQAFDAENRQLPVC